MRDCHVHIERGNYTIEWINEFIEHASYRGITELYLLEHSHRFREFESTFEKVILYNNYQKAWLENKLNLSLEDYINLILEARKHDFPIKVKFGLEVCYFEDYENIISDALSDFEWDFITGSVHWIDNWGFDHKKEFWEGKDVDLQYKRYYEIMKNLIKSGMFDILAHPDSIKCFGHQPSYELFDTYSEIADLLNLHHMRVEQSAGLYMNYGYHELGMNKNMLDIFKRKSVNIITASDAHKPEDAGKYIYNLNNIIMNSVDS